MQLAGNMSMSIRSLFSPRDITRPHISSYGGEGTGLCPVIDDQIYCGEVEEVLRSLRTCTQHTDPWRWVPAVSYLCREDMETLRQKDTGQ